MVYRGPDARGYWQSDIAAEEWGLMLAHLCSHRSDAGRRRKKYGINMGTGKE